MVLKDKDSMPWGKHKGKKMEDVPAKDLMWYYENGKCNAPVALYIRENLDVLKQEIKDAEKASN